MAPSLLILPPEIRLEIYRHLLRDSNVRELARGSSEGNECRVVCLIDPERPAMMSTGILATCHCIHQEALPILYQKNRFVVRLGLKKPGESKPGADFPVHKLAMLRYLTVLIVDFATIHNVNPAMVVDTLRWMSAAHCSFHRLRFNFLFFSDWEQRYNDLQAQRAALDLALRQIEDPNAEGEEHTFEPVVSAFARDSAIVQAIADLGVTGQVDIMLMDQIKVKGSSFDGMAGSIASAKGWSCTKVKGDFKVLLPMDMIQRKWILKPARKDGSHERARD